MPNETHLKRLISDAVFEVHNTHGRQTARDPLHISREDSLIIASAVFDALKRANCLLRRRIRRTRPHGVPALRRIGGDVLSRITPSGSPTTVSSSFNWGSNDTPSKCARRSGSIGRPARWSDLLPTMRWTAEA